MFAHLNFRCPSRIEVQWGAGWFARREGGDCGPQPSYMGPHHEPGCTDCTCSYRWEGTWDGGTTSRCVCSCTCFMLIIKILILLAMWENVSLFHTWFFLFSYRMMSWLVLLAERSKGTVLNTAVIKVKRQLVQKLSLHQLDNETRNVTYFFADMAVYHCFSYI